MVRLFDTISIIGVYDWFLFYFIFFKKKAIRDFPPPKLIFWFLSTSRLSDRLFSLFLTEVINSRSDILGHSKHLEIQLAFNPFTIFSENVWHEW